VICCDRFFIFLSLANLAQNQPFQKTALFFASLVKGEVLSPERIRANAGGIAFLPHPFRFSDTSANNPSIVGSASHCNRSSPLHKGAKGDTALSTLPKPHYPLPCTKLASLVKGEVLSPERIRATTGGIALHPPTSPSPQPFQKDNNPSLHDCPFIQYVNHSKVCSQAHSSAFGTASPQDRCKAPK